MVSQTTLATVLVILVVVAGVIGYFAGSSAVPPPKTVTVTTTVGTPGIPTTITTTVTQKITETVIKTVTAAPVPGEKYVLKLVTYHPKIYFRYWLYEEFAKLVENMSNGRLKIEVYYCPEINIASGEIAQAVARGVVDLGSFYGGYYVGVDPFFAMLGDFPGPARDAYYGWMFTLTLQDLVKKTIEEKFGVVFVGPWSMTSFGTLLHFNKPISSIDDLKGKIIRISGAIADFISMFGAQPTMLPAGELYQAMQLRTIDGMEWGAYTENYPNKWHEVGKYVVEMWTDRFTMVQPTTDIWLIANPTTWNKLPDDLKAVIKTALTYIWWRYAELGGPTYQEVYKQKMIDEGAVIIKLPKEDEPKLIDAALKLYAGYAKKSPTCYEAVQRIIKLWKDLGYSDWAEGLSKLLKS
jgi:TRAP-type C4-dicarboxylate transport system substrate-binding protein